MTPRTVILKNKGGITIKIDADAMSLMYENEHTNIRKIYKLEDTGKGLKIDLFGSVKLSTFLNRKGNKNEIKKHVGK